MARPHGPYLESDLRCGQSAPTADSRIKEGLVGPYLESDVQNGQGVACAKSFMSAVFSPLR